MLKESYIANWKNLPHDAIKIRVARPSILAPSKNLLWLYKHGNINWKEYESCFRREILANPEAYNKLREIAKLSEEKDVYLICYEKKYPCHRFILLEMVDEIKEELRDV